MRGISSLKAVSVPITANIVSLSFKTFYPTRLQLDYLIPGGVELELMKRKREGINCTCAIELAKLYRDGKPAIMGNCTSKPVFISGRGFPPPLFIRL